MEGFTRTRLGDSSYGSAGGLGTSRTNLPACDATVVVSTQRAADEPGFPAVCVWVADLVRGSTPPNRQRTGGST